MADKEIEEPIKGMLNISLDAAKFSTKSMNAQRQAADISCFSLQMRLESASVRNALEVRDVLKTEALEEIKG